MADQKGNPYNRNTLAGQTQQDDISKKNNRNKESPLYVALTRLFSGPLSTYREQSQIRYKRRDLDRFKFTSASGQSFKKKSYNPFEAIQTNIMANQSRAERYSDFDQMEFMPEIASALDIYADEMTTSNQFRNLITIECKNDEIKQILNTLFYKTLNVESNLFSWARTMCKFGDFFLYLDIDEQMGVKNVLGLPSPEVERLEGEDETNPGYVQFQWNSAGITFENWQIAHFRVLGQDKYSPYGTSILESVRRIWRQLQLLEDAMMAYRIVRAPDRRVFYIDVGNVSPQEVETYMQKVITGMKRNQIVDPNTGRVDLRYNPMSIDEDYYIPVRGQNLTKIDTLQGGSFTGDIDDVKYLRDKLFSGLKIPQAYLARGEGQAEDKTMLAQKDMRFARTIQRLQRVLVSELEKIAMIHLYTIGFRNDDLLKFRVKLNNPSKLAELQEIEHFKAQLTVAASAKENGFSKRWIFEQVFKMPDHEFLRNQRDLFYDASITKSLEAVGAEAAEGGGGASADLGGGGLEAGGETPPAPETPAAGGGGEAGGGGSKEESPLLAAPARREDGSAFTVKKPHLTSGAKGKWYTPVGMDDRGGGARTRHYQSQWSNEISSDTDRNVFKGLNTLGRGIAEQKDDLYEKDETLLLEVEQKLNSLNESLNKKKQSGDKKDETQ
jgi:hypothetical protein